MRIWTRFVLAACFAAAALNSDAVTAATARSMIAELTALEKEVKSVSAMGATGADGYSKKVSDFRSRFAKVSDVTAEQRSDVFKRLSMISSDIRSKTTQTGGKPLRQQSSAHRHQDFPLQGQGCRRRDRGRRVLAAARHFPVARPASMILRRGQILRRWAICIATSVIGMTNSRRRFERRVARSSPKN
jgi:hypothetical protein